VCERILPDLRINAPLHLKRRVDETTTLGAFCNEPIFAISNSPPKLQDTANPATKVDRPDFRAVAGTRFLL
jgi:hypothetical protein